MSNGSGAEFSWLSFLLGLAIGLWISIVVLFLTDWNDHDHCCPGSGTVIVPGPGGDAWIPGGNDEYYCTNDDEGGAIVVDEGGAIVVDEGGAIVVDAGRVPAPGDDADQLNRNRGYREFRCTVNDEGGAIVVDATGRTVVVSMPNSYDSNRCGRSGGHAVVLNPAGTPIDVDGNGQIKVDEGTAIVVDEMADGIDDQELPSGAPTSGQNLAYCMVADPSKDPIVIRPPTP